VHPLSKTGGGVYIAVANKLSFSNMVTASFTFYDGDLDSDVYYVARGEKVAAMSIVPVFLLSEWACMYVCINIIIYIHIYM
jgi:hypothetical protein